MHSSWLPEESELRSICCYYSRCPGRSGENMCNSGGGSGEKERLET